MQGRKDMEPIETRQLSQQVYEVLREGIINGDLAPAEQIVDLKLAEKFGVSRTPVKDALNRLAADGLVDIVPRRGTFVTRIEPRLLDEVFDIRGIMEVYAVERAVDLIGSEELHKMRELLDEWQSMLRGPETFSEERFKSINAEFHRTLVHSCRNQKLIELYDNLNVFLKIARVRYRREIKERVKSLDEHRLILQALESGDKVGAKEIVASHIDRAKEELLESLRFEENTASHMGGSE